jgi:hypothetical protein
MKKDLLVFLLIIITNNIFSQKNLKPGYVVLNSNDTLKGFIDYRGDILNCSKCVFYSNIEAQATTYNPGDIKAYRFNEGRYYISRNIKIKSKEKVVFLEYLVNGITSLYFYRDDLGDYYFIEKGGNIYELSHSLTVISDGERDYYKESNLYKGQLKVIYGEANDLMPKINNARFDRKTMMKLSEDYHNITCSDRKCIIYEKKLPGSIITFGPILRYDFITATYEGFMSNFDHENRQSFRIGAGMNVQLISVNEKLNFELKALIGKEKSHGYYSGTSGEIMNTYTLDFSTTKITIIPDIKYIYPSGKVRPSVSLGLEYGQVISQNSTYKIQHLLNGTVFSEDVTDDLISNKFDIGVILTTGIVTNLKKITLNIDLWGKVGGALYREFGTKSYGSDISYYSRLFCAGLCTSLYF